MKETNPDAVKTVFEKTFTLDFKLERGVTKELHDVLVQESAALSFKNRRRKQSFKKSFGYFHTLDLNCLGVSHRQFMLTPTIVVNIPRTVELL